MSNSCGTRFRGAYEEKREEMTTTVEGGLPSHPWEKGLKGGGIRMPPYSRGRSRGPAGAEFFALNHYILSRSLSPV